MGGYAVGDDVDGLSSLTHKSRDTNPRQYFWLDLRLGGKPLEWIEVAPVAQNLTDPRHAAFDDVLGSESSQIPRSPPRQW